MCGDVRARLLHAHTHAWVSVCACRSHWCSHLLGDYERDAHNRGQQDLAEILGGHAVDLASLSELWLLIASCNKTNAKSDEDASGDGQLL